MNHSLKYWARSDCCGSATDRFVLENEGTGKGGSAPEDRAAVAVADEGGG